MTSFLPVTATHHVCLTTDGGSGPTLIRRYGSDGDLAKVCEGNLHTVWRRPQRSATPERAKNVVVPPVAVAQHGCLTADDGSGADPESHISVPMADMAEACEGNLHNVWRRPQRSAAHERITSIVVPPVSATHHECLTADDGSGPTLSRRP